MLDFSSFLNLPLIWAIIIATAIFLYVLLDGFDLGVGILFPFAPTDKCRSKMMNSIVPFWDGNETWLVLGGGGLFAAFPLAYSILMPAFYLPIILMLLGLIFRGVAFEFRFKADTKSQQKIWDNIFHFGSLLAAFMQGVILGNFIQGVEVSGRSFAGGALDWVNGFGLMTGIALIFGYALLGSTWLIIKTTEETQKWARYASYYILIFVMAFVAIISISMPFLDIRVSELWFSLPNFYYFLPIPIITAFCFNMIWNDLSNKKREVRPFLTVLMIFFLCYLGLGISMWPWIVPFNYSIWDASATATSQSLLLIGTAIFLPIILCYTAYSYYIFRGKSDHNSMY